VRQNCIELSAVRKVITASEYGEPQVIAYLFHEAVSPKYTSDLDSTKVE